MQANRLTVRLVGPENDGGAVFFADFRDFCANLSACLRATEAAVVGTGSKLKYKIVGLELGSACGDLGGRQARQGRDIRDKVLNTFRRTVAAIQKGKTPDRRLNQEALETFRKLAVPLDHQTRQVWVDDTLITPAFAVNLDKIVGATLPSETFVSGRVDRVNVHERLEFVLYPPIGGVAITCLFDEELLPKVRRALRRNATVHGKFYFRENSAYPDRAVAHSLDIHPDDDDLPTLGSLRGIAPGLTGELSSVDFVRALRDA